MPTAFVFRFAGARTANRLVAGAPAAARLEQGFAASRPGESLALMIADGGGLTPDTRSEIERLAPDIAVQIVDPSPDGTVPGEALTDPAAMAASTARLPARPGAAQRQGLRSTVWLTPLPIVLSSQAQGEEATVLIFAAALAVQIIGLKVLGHRAWRREGVVHFDSAKAAVAP